MLLDPRAVGADRPDAAGPEASGSWELHHCPDHGHAFYYHTGTGESRWDPPPELQTQCVYEEDAPALAATPEENAKLQSFSASHGSRRRMSVSATPVDKSELGDWMPPFYEKPSQNWTGIKATIAASASSQVLFGHLSGASLDAVIGAMFDRRVEVGETVIQQGADGDYFYIVNSGTYDIYVQRKPDAAPDKVFCAGPGASFGELALMYNVPRAATVCCVEAGSLWCLERDCFQMMLATVENFKTKEHAHFLRQVSVLSDLTTLELNKLSDLLEEVLYDESEHIVCQGEVGDAVYFLSEGACKAYMMGDQGEIEVRHYGEPGEFFGEIALVNQEPRRATVRASGDGCLVLRLKREDVDLSVGSVEARLKECVGQYQPYQAFLPT